MSRSAPTVDYGRCHENAASAVGDARFTVLTALGPGRLSRFLNGAVPRPGFRAVERIFFRKF